uniref:alanine--tRNA ligase n=1 Tax=Plectus sambesii TaxID=2011161 RepID=A0A914X5A0_9BILA
STEFSVNNTQPRGGYIMLIGKVEGTIKVGDTLNQTIDEPRRELIMKNHTGTHVLNYALRQVLKDAADQKGSLVAPDRMRFDFTAKGAMTPEQVKETEMIAQALIDQNGEVFAKDSSLAQAKAVKGLRAVFDETYPDPVRVVSIGVPVEQLLGDPDGPAGNQTSVEFCGGTHLRRAGHVGKFVIASEEAIAKGIRRMYALTGPEAERAIHRADRFEQRIAELVKTIEGDKSLVNDRDRYRATSKQIFAFDAEVIQSTLPQWRRDELRTKAKAATKILDGYAKQAQAAVAEKVLAEAKTLVEKAKNEKVVVHIFPPGATGKALDSALKQLKTTSAAMAFSVDEEQNRITVFAKVDQASIDSGLKATEWVNAVCELVGGKGGGKETQAQAVGNRPEAVDQALQLAREFAKTKIGS